MSGTKNREPLVSFRINEDHSLTRIFDVLRTHDIDITWVKNQVYGTSCIPETCPSTRDLYNILVNDLEEGEIREPATHFIDFK